MSPRRPSPGHPGARELAAAIEHLEELYAQLPALSCPGLRGASCVGRIDASTTERCRLLANAADS